MKSIVFLLVLGLIGVTRSACPHKLTSGGFRDVDGCFANRMYFPLCGDDGCTYINQGLLDCVNENNINEGRAVVNVAYPGMCRDDGSSGSNSNPASGVAGNSKQEVTTLASNSNQKTQNNVTGSGSIDLLSPNNNRHLPGNSIQSGTRQTSRANVPSSGCSLTSSSIMIQSTEILGKMSEKIAKEYFGITLYNNAPPVYVTHPELATTNFMVQNTLQSIAAVILVTALTMIM